MNKLIGKPVSESRVEMTQLVLPVHANAMGNVFGGQVMAWIDTAAAVCSYRHCRTRCVTVSMDALDFVSPVRLGDILILRASLNFTGTTSMEVGVKVLGEDPLSGHQSHTASAYLTFVAIDDHNHPIPVPPVVPETDEDRRRYQAAQIRRAQRLANKAAFKP